MSWFPETVLEPRPLPGYPSDAVSPCQWLSTEAAFADTGGLVSGNELAELIRSRCRLRQASEPVALVARWISFKNVVSLDSPWGLMLPVFQFDLPRAAIHPGVLLVLSELKGVLDDAELALWFVTPNEWLQEARPVEGLNSHLSAVRQAARTDRFVALGG
ncbi:hypothetical protein [Hydrogenophaga sp. 2FB]|uniref:hypothetical protein n=1 Tax=Hydrogenophaga sp. 2FB TaxID=2502187 RepID=UPI0010F44094|nr:hypothetical protein [Hydrogenophaga sp. 2FB]